MVIGGGPAGAFAVAALAHKSLSVGWVDASGHDAGALSQLVGVPANTHGARVRAWFQGGFLDDAPAFAADARVRRAKLLRDDEFPPLGVLAGAVRALTEHCGTALPGVTPIRARATSLDRDDESGRLVVGIHSAAGAGSFLRARGGVVLCTGAAPRAPPCELTSALAAAQRHVALIDMPTALDPERMRGELDRLGAQRVGVIGRSHSGVLAARNVHLARGGGACVLYHDAKPIKIAVPLGDHYIHDFTGLKGKAADFAVEHLIDDEILPGGAPDGAEHTAVEQRAYTSLLARGAVDAAELDAVVVCTGFDRRAPVESVNGVPLSVEAVRALDVDSRSFELIAPSSSDTDPRAGGGSDSASVWAGLGLHGLYGTGIGFAPLHRAYYGNERAIGVGIFRTAAEAIAEGIAARCVA